MPRLGMSRDVVTTPTVVIVTPTISTATSIVIVVTPVVIKATPTFIIATPTRVATPTVGIIGVVDDARQVCSECDFSAGTRQQLHGAAIHRRYSSTARTLTVRLLAACLQTNSKNN